MKIGFYPMAADILHAGHMLAIEEAKQNCDYLIIGLNCTPDGKNPVQSIYERYIQLRAVKWVDEVIPYQGKADLENVVASLNYNIRFLGSDYMYKSWDGKEIEEKLGKEVYFLSRNHSFSSTNIKQRLLQK